ncbi:type IV pilus twitching motility protein PilT [Candidatus Microgenomates bacterium]|nr:type IV pilus twitching motility protein PilT [Candidatus Microgenomates bacterium]
MMEIKQLLQLTVDRNASDLHLIVGLPPTLRVEGVLYPVQNESPITAEEIEKNLRQVMAAEQAERFFVNKELDFSLSFSEKARFRVNAYFQRGTPAASFRRLPLIIPDIDSLGLPSICHNFATLRQGFVLVTGPTGHGKSTTLAAILNEINKERAEHIVTIEDPIEFIFKPEKSIITQREMTLDTHSWGISLRSVLREDPNVVLVGEMRDLETISSALTIAETGHLVFATLHTNSAAQTIDRIVDVFPREQQEQIKLQLSSVLEGVFSQRLLPGIDGRRVLAYEVMLGTPAIQTVVREGKTHQIDSIIQTSGEVGMISLETTLAKLVKEGKITLEIAQSYSLHSEDLTRLIKA